MVAVDGDVDDDELSIIQRLNRGGQTSDWNTAIKAWKTKTTDECIKLTAAAMDDHQRLVCITNLVDIAMADGILAGEEEDLLERYLSAFNIQAADIEKVVDVIAIKNDKESFI